MMDYIDTNEYSPSLFEGIKDCTDFMQHVYECADNNELTTAEVEQAITAAESFIKFMRNFI
jgi:hypothetical protein